MAIATATGVTPKKKKTLKITAIKPPATASNTSSTVGPNPTSAAGAATGAGTVAAPKITTINPNPTPVMPGGYNANNPSAQGLSTSPSYNGSPVGNDTVDRNPRNQDSSNNTGGISNPMSGFAKRYDPTKLDPLYADQNIILQDLLESKGMGLGSGSAQMGDYAQRMGHISDLLSLVQSGQNPDAGNDEHWINTVAELLNNSMGAGGTQMDYSSILQMLLNPKTGGGLSEYLYGDSDAPLTVGQQDSMLKPMYLAGITGMNPAMQQAMANAYNGASTVANRDVTHGAQDPRITQYLKDKLSGIVPGL